MFPIEYTLANESHIPTLIDFRIKFLTEFQGAQTHETEEQLRRSLQQYFNRTLNNSTYICWFASVGDDIAGIGGISIREHPGNFKNIEGRVGYVLNMYTVETYRGNGICTGILNRLLDTARSMGIHSFELHATEAGEPIYVKNGFLKHNEPTYRKYDPDFFN